MKKIQLLIVMLVLLSISNSSCNKNKEYCASCVETTTGYRPTDFCSTEDAVDAYISELKSTGSAAGQNWNCTKK